MASELGCTDDAAFETEASGSDRPREASRIGPILVSTCDWRASPKRDKNRKWESKKFVGRLVGKVHQNPVYGICVEK